MVKQFEDLAVYQRAYKTALHIHRLSLGFPKIEQYALADQARRASKSICANIAEGFGKQHKSVPEFRRFLLMALGSANEMKVWVRFCFDLEYLDQESFEIFINDYDEISKMLNGLMRNWKE